MAFDSITLLEYKVLLRVMEMVKNNQIPPEMALKLLEPPSAAAKVDSQELLQGEGEDGSSKRKRESTTQGSETSPDPMSESPPKKDPKCTEPLLDYMNIAFMCGSLFPVPYMIYSYPKALIRMPYFNGNYPPRINKNLTSQSANVQCNCDI